MYGVHTNGAAAEVMNFDRLGKRYAKLTDRYPNSPCQKTGDLQ